MPATIRKALASDVHRWLDLVKATIGEDYPDKQAYDPVWVASQFAPGADVETWVADNGTKLVATVAVLPPLPGNNNPVANAGRLLILPEAFTDGSAAALIARVEELAMERKQLVVSRV